MITTATDLVLEFNAGKDAKPSQKEVHEQQRKRTNTHLMWFATIIDSPLSMGGL